MIKIAKDTPREIYDLILLVDINKISEEQINNWTEQLVGLANKYNIPRRVGRVETISINQPAKVQLIGNLTVYYDFSKIPLFKRKLAMPIIKNWIKQNLPLRKDAA